ncbi:winged helix DNA-binding domain-containing protein [Ktedonospora formicarum]|uniref:Winged helix DNA-binding domain-containing protein n=1 Tax=Ktedonospora formicarum TaxID=2778364 RepID=A0A8J3I1U5_9CHLR|nr:winged helix DNA-binding domain-containing protein [Ktedonospora formicarum]GHO47774.1 hypothetical protein KSX_59370 [Ktedonospora formicarum]
MAERILTLRELNRATLARQFLLERVSQSLLDAIKHLIALQGQVSNAPYIGLWTRLRAFERDFLSNLLEARHVVRASSLRGTLHLLMAEDYLWIHPLLRSTLNRNLHLFARKAQGFELDRFVKVMQAYIQEQPRTGVELRAKMEEFFPGMGKQQIADAVRMHLALIQILPAGMWGFTGKPAHIQASAWLGQPFASPQEGLHDLIRRYLAAFGPASARDIQAWSGLTGIQSSLEALRPELQIYRDEQGKELFDLLDAPIPPAETPAPVRFLPAFDNLIYGYADRLRVITNAYRPFISHGNIVVQVFLVDGFVHGLWKTERRDTSVTLVIEPFGPLSLAVQNELQQEGERLLRWIADDAEAFEIQFRFHENR